LHATFAQFLGDVFVYLNKRGDAQSPGSIISSIVAGLESGIRERAESKEPLVVVAHSMGGNIVYDILTHFRPELAIDHFVTVGSQVAVFEELKLFKVSDRAIPNERVKRVPKPVSVGRWLNIFDHSDLLGFAAEKVFEGVEDFEYDTGSTFKAHSPYFSSPIFHYHLAGRLCARQ
jgi:hypothetical protein